MAKSYLYAFLMDFALWMPIWVLYLQDRRGLSLTQITFLDVPFFLLIVVAQVPAGVIADRFGRKYSIMIGAAFFAVAVLVFGLATNYPLILTSYILWSLAVTFRVGADSALLYDTLKQIGQEERFHGAMGRLWATRSTALLAGLLLGAPLASATNFSFTFEASAGLALAAIVVALWMHEPRHVAVEAREAMGQTLLQGVGEAWRQPAIRYVILYSGVVSLGFFGPVVIFQQPWLAEHGVATQHLGLWQAPARAGEIAAALGAGWLLLRMGERAAFFALPVTLVACNLALAGIDHSWIVAAFVGIGVVSGLQNPFLANYINHRIDSERRATVLSVQSVVQNVMLAGAQPLGGVIADAWGLRAVFLMFAMMVLVLGGGTLALWERARAGERVAAAFGATAVVPADGA